MKELRFRDETAISILEFHLICDNFNSTAQYFFPKLKNACGVTIGNSPKKGFWLARQSGKPSAI